MAQRLVRRLCPKCKQKQKIKPDDLALVKGVFENAPKSISALGLNDGLEIYYPGKCAECNQTGYRGRVGVYELFEIDREIESLILKSPAISEVQETAIKKGMVTLLQDGFLKVLDGITSVEEIMRVVGI